MRSRETSDDLRLVRVRVEPGAGDVVVRVFRDQELRPVRAVEPDEPARVGARRATAPAGGDRPRRTRADGWSARPPARPRGSSATARRSCRGPRSSCRRRLGRCDGRAHVEAPVGDETDEARVVDDLRELAARERELEDVVQLRVLPVQADEDPVGEVLVDVLDACLDALERRQVSLLDPSRARRRTAASSRRRPDPGGTGCAGCRGPRRTGGSPGRRRPSRLDRRRRPPCAATRSGRLRAARARPAGGRRARCGARTARGFRTGLRVERVGSAAACPNATDPAPRAVSSRIRC